MPRIEVLICCLGSGLKKDGTMGKHGLARIEKTADLFRQNRGHALVAFSGTPQEVERFEEYWQANFGTKSLSCLVTDRNTFSTPDHAGGIDKALELHGSRSLNDYDYIHVVSSYFFHAWRSVRSFKDYLRLKHLQGPPKAVLSPVPVILMAYKATPISAKRLAIELAQCLIALVPALSNMVAFAITRQRKKQLLPLTNENSGSNP